MAKKRQKETADPEHIKRLLLQLVEEELQAVADEVSPGDVWIELAFWRVAYKTEVRNTSSKASMCAQQANEVKAARIAMANDHIAQAVKNILRRGEKPTQKRIEDELASWNNPSIYSADDPKRALVKPGTVKEWLTNYNKNTEEK